MRAEFRIASGTTAALDTGAGLKAPRPAVLFVPGYTGSKEDFMPLLRSLTDAGYRVVAIDQRGQYESSWAADDAGYTIEALGYDVCEIASELRQFAAALHLVGHSFGGLVTRSAVLAEPDLFDTLTLMGSGPAAIEGERRAILNSTESVLAEQGMEAVWDQMAARAQTDPRFRQSPPALLAFLRTRFLANDPAGLRVMGGELRTDEDRTESLAAIAVRKLVLHGVDDDAWPPTVQQKMAERLDANYEVIDAAAHSPAVENPRATLAALMRFWQTPTGQAKNSSTAY